jgi:hypothetical protein
MALFLDFSVNYDANGLLRNTKNFAAHCPDTLIIISIAAYRTNFRNPKMAEQQIQELQKQIEQLKASQQSPYDVYQTSLTSRYCSAEMTQLFSQRSRHSTWRKLWLGLAEAEHELGIDTITPQALEEMKAHLIVTDEDFEAARIEERIRRHVSWPSCICLCYTLPYLIVDSFANMPSL